MLDASIPPRSSTRNVALPLPCSTSTAHAPTFVRGVRRGCHVLGYRRIANGGNLSFAFPNRTRHPHGSLSPTSSTCSHRFHLPSHTLPAIATASLLFGTRASTGFDVPDRPLPGAPRGSHAAEDGSPLGWGAAARLGGKGREAVPRVRFGRWNGPPISSGRKEVRVAMEGRRGSGTTRTWGTQLLDGRATIATQPAIAQHFSAARGKGGGQACLPLHGGRRSGRGWRIRGLLVAPVLAAHLQPEATGGQDSTR